MAGGFQFDEDDMGGLLGGPPLMGVSGGGGMGMGGMGMGMGMDMGGGMGMGMGGGGDDPYAYEVPVETGRGKKRKDKKKRKSSSRDRERTAPRTSSGAAGTGRGSDPALGSGGGGAMSKAEMMLQKYGGGRQAGRSVASERPRRVRPETDDVDDDEIRFSDDSDEPEPRSRSMTKRKSGSLQTVKQATGPSAADSFGGLDEPGKSVRFVDMSDMLREGDDEDESRDDDGAMNFVGGPHGTLTGAGALVSGGMSSMSDLDASADAVGRAGDRRSETLGNVKAFDMAGLMGDDSEETSGFATTVRPGGGVDLGLSRESQEDDVDELDESARPETIGNVMDISALGDIIAENPAPDQLASDLQEPAVEDSDEEDPLGDLPPDKVFRAGVPVEARYGGDEEWYTGSILRDNRDGTFAIRYDDGDSESHLRREFIRLRGSAAAPAEAAESSEPRDVPQRRTPSPEPVPAASRSEVFGNVMDIGSLMAANEPKSEARTAPRSATVEQPRDSESASSARRDASETTGTVTAHPAAHKTLDELSHSIVTNTSLIEESRGELRERTQEREQAAAKRVSPPGRRSPRTVGTTNRQNSSRELRRSTSMDDGEYSMDDFEEATVGGESAADEDKGDYSVEEFDSYVEGDTPPVQASGTAPDGHAKPAAAAVSVPSPQTVPRAVTNRRPGVAERKPARAPGGSARAASVTPTDVGAAEPPVAPTYTASTRIARPPGHSIAVGTDDGPPGAGAWQSYPAHPAAAAFAQNGAVPPPPPQFGGPSWPHVGVAPPPPPNAYGAWPFGAPAGAFGSPYGHGYVSHPAGAYGMPVGMPPPLGPLGAAAAAPAGYLPRARPRQAGGAGADAVNRLFSDARTATATGETTSTGRSTEKRTDKASVDSNSDVGDGGQTPKAAPSKGSADASDAPPAPPAPGLERVDVDARTGPFPSSRPPPTIEALASFQANVAAAHQVFAQHLSFVRDHVRRCRLQADAITESASSYKYSSLKDTQRYLKRHRPKVISMEEAMKRIEQGDDFGVDPLLDIPRSTLPHEQAVL